MRRFSVPVALSALLFASPACTKSGKQEADKDAGEAGEVGEVGEGSTAGPAVPAGGGKTLIEVEKLARLVPADAVAVGAFAGPQRLFEVFGRDEIVAKLGPLYTDATKELREVTGQDLLSPEGLAAFGVDPKAPVTIFALEFEDARGGVVVGLSNRDAFVASITKLAAADEVELETHEHGDATIMCPERDEGCVMVTASHGYLLGADDGGALELAKRIAVLQPEHSLASSPGFGRAIAHLEGGRDMTGYVNLEGPVAEALASLGAQNTPRELAQADLMRSLIGPIRALVVGAELEQRSLTGQMFVETSGPSLLGSVVKNGTRVNPIVTAMGKDAILVGHYNLDLDAIWTLAEKAAAAEGESLDEIRAGLLALTGLELRTEVMTALSGEFGFGVAADVDQMFAIIREADEAGSDAVEQELLASIEGAVTIGLVDGAKGHALLEKALSKPAVAGFVKRDEARDLWTVTLPIGKTLLVTVATPSAGAPFIAIASSQELLDRVVQGRGSGTEAANPGYAEFIGHGDLAGLYAGRQILFAAGIWMTYASADGSVVAEAVPANESPEHAKIRAELEDVRTDLGELRRQESRDKAMLLGEFLSPWGSTAASLRVTPNGFDVRMGQFIDAPSWAALASGLVDSGKKMATLSAAQSERRAVLYAREAELQNELFEQAAAQPGQ